MLTTDEQAELDGLQGFLDLLGATEMEDADFDRYLALLTKRKERDA